MLATPFRMNSKDFSSYVQKDGVTISYSYRKGLPDKNTMDSKRHVDLGGNKRIVTVRFNPQTEAVSDLILNEYRSGLIYLTIWDGSTITFLSEPTAAAVKNPALTKAGVVTMYQISPLTFEEL